MFSSHLRPEAIFLRYPEGQTTNVLFLEILTRATPHASCIHLSRARTSALHPSPSLSRAHSAPSDQTTHTCTSIQTSTVSGSRGPPPLLNCTYPSLTRAVPPVAQLHVSISHARIQYSYAHLHTSIALFPTIAVRGSSHLLLLLLDGGHAEVLARKREQTCISPDSIYFQIPPCQSS